MIELFFYYNNLYKIDLPLDFKIGTIIKWEIYQILCTVKMEIVKKKVRIKNTLETRIQTKFYEVFFPFPLI